MAEGPGAALRILDELASSGELKEYHLLYAARADLLRRLGEHREAASNYSQALALVKNERERVYLQRRLREVQSAL
jgi:RNA polymerase sigma-70 factor (ECF subfamily)